METSTKLCFLVISLTVLCLVAADITSDVFDETPKCMPPPAGLKILSDCFQETMGKPFDETTMKQSHFSKDEKVKISMCAGKHFGMISADEKIDVAKTVVTIDMFIADDAIKAKLKTGTSDCGSKSTDAMTFLHCFHDVFMKECA